ncbi:MAG TPA: PEGA domain-containing protein [Polyangiales bacterium]|nr:PEGA domain-containing protein [Polyangiales bacterium]
MHLRNLCIGAALSVALFSVTASAQQRPAPTSAANEPQTVRGHLDKADRAYSEGRYADAVQSFLAADRLQPTPALQLALGKTYEQLNDSSRALASYREYFVRAPRAPDRAQVQARVAVLATQLAERGVQQISVSSVPAGATVIIDTKALGTTPIYVDLSPGPHHLEFHRDGYESAGLDFELSPQQPLNVMTTLVPLRPGAVASATPAPAAAPAPTPAPAAPQPATEPPAETAAAPTADPAALASAEAPLKKHDDVTTIMRSVGFGALGGSVLTLGTAVAFELMRSQSESRARQQRQQIAFKDTLDTMHTQQTVARVFAVTAGVLAAAGGVLLVLAAQRERSEPNPEGATVACAPTGCSAVYQGRF